MASVKERTYAGQTADERAAQRRDQLLAATFALVAEDGWRQLRIERICLRAGLNKRYFYESFEDLDAAIGALMSQLAEAAIAVTVAALDPSAPPAEFVRAAVTALVGYATDDPRRARVLFGATPAGEAASRHRLEAIRRIAAAAAAQGHSYHAIADDPIIELSAALLVGGTSHALLEWLDRRIPVSREQLIDDLTSLWQVVSDGAAARAREKAATATS
jgi:AcrR family transcriptional regulator